MVFEVNVNYWAVLVAAIVSFVIGGLWYSPMLFGKLWMQLSGLTNKDMEAAKKKGMTKSYILQFVASLITACVLAHFISLLNIGTVPELFQLVFLAWIGFQAANTVGMVLWEGKPWSLYLLNTASCLVTLAAMGLTLFWMGA